MTFAKFKDAVNKRLNNLIGMPCEDMPDLTNLSDFFEEPISEAEFDRQVKECCDQILEDQSEDSGFDFSDFLD